MTELALEVLEQPVELVGQCAGADCLKFAAELRMKIDADKYRHGAAIMDNPETLGAWRAEHRTARKRADRAVRRGYVFGEVDLSKHSDDIFEINTSLETRQGRPMSDGYTHRIERSPLPDYPCEMHNIRTYGVLADEQLVAYLSLYRCCELGLVSMILGHGEHLEQEIMYLLFAGAVEDQAGYPGILYYNTWDSGTDGLRFYKQRVGFREGSVEWIL